MHGGTFFWRRHYRLLLIKEPKDLRRVMGSEREVALKVMIKETQLLFKCTFLWTNFLHHFAVCFSRVGVVFGLGSHLPLPKDFKQGFPFSENHL